MWSAFTFSPSLPHCMRICTQVCTHTHTHARTNPCKHTSAGLDQERQVRMPNILIYCLALSRIKLTSFLFPGSHNICIFVRLFLPVSFPFSFSSLLHIRESEAHIRIPTCNQYEHLEAQVERWGCYENCRDSLSPQVTKAGWPQGFVLTHWKGRETL